jgi:hypothetical protein
MRLSGLVCLACVVGTPALASAGDDKDSNPTEWGVGAQVRRSYVSPALQKLFVDDTPGPAEQDGGGVTFNRRTKGVEMVLGFGYDPIKPTEGYYLDKGGDPLGPDDVDYVQFDKKLSWATVDATFIGHINLHKILAIRLGGGVGIGFVIHHAYRTSALCTSERIQDDCTINPLGPRQKEPVNLPVLPVLNVLAGIELRPFKWVAIYVDVGLHTAPYIGAGLTLYPWKT